MPQLIRNGKMVKQFEYNYAGKRACRNEAIRIGGKCVENQDRKANVGDEEVY